MGFQKFTDFVVESEKRKENNIKEKKQSEYQKFFKKKMDEWDISSPADLNDEDKKKFFNEVQKEWNK